MKIHFFKTYLFWGVVGLIVAVVLGAFGYFVIYKRMLKGNKEISKIQIIFGGLFITYIIMVLGFTILNRHSTFLRGINIHFLSSYREAWNSFSLHGWQFIFLNILMFVPFGFLLPLLWRKFRKVYNVFIAALLFTIFIELFQLVGTVGIFDIDDIFNNVLGALIGYGIAMVLLSITRPDKRRILKVAGFLSPLIITVAAFTSIFTYYYNKDFGNIPYAHSHKLNLKNTNIELNISLKDNKGLIPIFKAPTYTKDESIQWAKQFFDNLGIGDSDLEIDAYSDSVILWRRGEPTYNIRFDYIGGGYSFADFSHFDKEREAMNIEEALLLDTLSDFGISIPKEAEFISKDIGSYQWDVDKFVQGERLIDGNVTCTYYNDNTIKELNNRLITYERVKDVSIKSEKEAFEELIAGKFQYYYDFDENINDIIVKSVGLDYILDTKGFYQPVYSFTSVIDGSEYCIIIPAIG